VEEDPDLPRYFHNNSIMLFDVTEHIRYNLNRIQIRSSSVIDDPLCLAYPPMLMGNFSIRKGTRGWILSDAEISNIRHGSWTDFGFPYLSGKGVYSQSFEVPDNYKKVFLNFKDVSGSLSVVVNDVDFGIKNWAPYSFDITDVLKKRRNILSVRVSNTIDNFLRMNSKDSGIINDVYLDVF
ncbi:MAG: hypothetical protein ACOCSE_02500, partial [Chitinivibrionales bacterium]